MSARITALVLSASCTLLLASGGCTATVIKPAPDGGAPPAATTPPPAPTDEPTIDAGMPVVDAGADGDDGVCHPGSAVGFTGSPYEPPDPSDPGKCTDRLIDAFLECLSGVAASCAEIETNAAAACLDCILPRGPYSEYWGPFLMAGTRGPDDRLNSAGCAAIINGDTTTTSCGKALADYEGCADFTCEAKCPDSYTACLVEASAGVCKAFTAAVKAKCPKDVHECYVRPTDKNGDDVRKRVIRRFCGPV